MSQLSDIADELDVVATWHSGRQQAKVSRLAEELRSIDTGSDAKVSTEQLGDLGVSPPPPADGF